MFQKTLRKQRLIERIESKKKHWKHKDGDWDTREKFDDYLAVMKKSLINAIIFPGILCLLTKTGKRLFLLQKQY